MSEKLDDINRLYSIVVGYLPDNRKPTAGSLLGLAQDAQRQVEWVQSVLAKHGYSGSLCEGSCPLEEMLQTLPEAKPYPADFAEYVIGIDGKQKRTFSHAEARQAAINAFDLGKSFTFTKEEFKFEFEWDFAINMLKQNQGLSNTALHALKLGLAAGLKIDL